MSKLLIQEPPLMVLPSLAVAVGLNESIVLQQLYFLLLDPRNGRKIAEHQWIFNTVEEWRCRFFPMWCERTIKTVFSNLSRMGLIETCQPEGRISRRKYYRINEEKLAVICERAKIAPSMMQATNGQKSSLPNGQHLHDGNGQKSSLPITKNTTENTAKNTKGDFRAGKSLCWFPKTKEKLKSILAENGIEYLPDYDGGFWEEMQRTNWTHKGKPIVNWIAFYKARVQHIQDCQDYVF